MLRAFAILSLLLLIAAGVLIDRIHQAASQRDLIAVNEAANRSMVQSFVNLHRPQIESAVLAPPRDRAQLAGRAETAALNQAARAFFAGVSVLKVKLYDRDGLTVYSSEAAQIGDDKSGNGGFRAARGGGVVNDLYFRGKFSAFEGEVSDRNLFATYLPVRAADGAIVAVIELYRDITPMMLAHEAEVRSARLQLTTVSLALYLLLLFIVLRADRALGRQIALVRQSEARLAAQNEELALAKQRAETANRAKSMFLANMSHELRTPLNAVIGFAQMIGGEAWGPLGSPRYRGYAEDIAASGAHLLGILDDLLDMSRVEAGKLRLEPERFDPADVIEQAMRYVAAAAQAAHVALEVAAAAQLPEVCLDRLRFRQVLINILSNAVKYTRPGGRVRVAVATDGNRLQIEVSDTGVGMTAEHIAIALTPFGQVRDASTRSIAGIGLGLPLTKALTGMLGGTLAITSEIDRGTTVRLSFPLAAQGAIQAAA